MPVAICTECGTEFPSTRSTAAYCSPACRQRAYRSRRDGGPRPSPAAPVPAPLTVTPPVTVTPFGGDLDADIEAFAETIRAVLRDNVPPVGEEPPKPEEIWDRLEARIPDFYNRMLQLEYRWVQDDLNEQIETIETIEANSYDDAINEWFDGWYRYHGGPFAEYIEWHGSIEPRPRTRTLHVHRPDCFDFIEEFIRDREQEWDDRS
jgi:hypothetical protein